MKYYKTWQEALTDYINRYGHLYQNVYNLMEEFENELQQNKHGAYFIYHASENMSRD